MSEHDKELIEIFKYMHAMCSVRGSELRGLLPQLAEMALDAGYWSDAFRVFLYDGDASVNDMRIGLASHIEELGEEIDKNEETAELIEVTYYLRKLLQPGEDVLAVAHYLLVELQDWKLQGGPPHLHLHDLAMEYYQWCFDYAEWMEGHELAEKKRETEVVVRKLAQHWLNQYGVPNPFDRL